MIFTTVGDAGNRADQKTGFGRVDFEFQIADKTVSNSDWCHFLTSVATYEDPFGLYNVSMTTGLFGGILRTTADNRYSYKPKPGQEKFPVVYVCWYDLARMANWMHFGQPVSGRSEMGTTEGSSAEGAYDTERFPSGTATVIPDGLPRARNDFARYWIPNENEWYKAAYHDPSKRGRRKYWNYPVRTDELPTNDPPPGTRFSANYFRGTFAVGRPHFLTKGGAYPHALSYWGTFDQGGNVWEWLEDWRIDYRGYTQVRTLRGGSAVYSEVGLHIGNTDPGIPHQRRFVWGGRLCRAKNLSEG